MVRRGEGGEEEEEEDINSTNMTDIDVGGRDPPDYSTIELKLENNNVSEETTKPHAASRFLAQPAGSPSLRNNIVDAQNSSVASAAQSFDPQHLVERAQLMLDEHKLMDEQLMDRTNQLHLADTLDDDQLDVLDYMENMEPPIDGEDQVKHDEWGKKVVSKLGGISENCLDIEDDQLLMDGKPRTIKSEASCCFGMNNLGMFDQPGDVQEQSEELLLDRTGEFFDQDIPGLIGLNCGTNMLSPVRQHSTVDTVQIPNHQQLFTRGQQKQQTLADNVHVFDHLYNGGKVHINHSTPVESVVHSYGNASLNSPGLAASAPATPAHMYHGSHASTLMGKVTPSYTSSGMHSHHIGTSTGGGIVQASMPPQNSPYLAATQSPAYHKPPTNRGAVQNSQNFFQFPSRPMSAAMGMVGGVGVVNHHPSSIPSSFVLGATSTHTPQSPYTPRHSRAAPYTPNHSTHGTLGIASRRFQFPPSSDHRPEGCDSPLATANQNSHAMKPAYHPYSQALASPHYMQSQALHHQQQQQKQRQEQSSSESFQREVQAMELVVGQHMQELHERDLHKQQQQHHQPGIFQHQSTQHDSSLGIATPSSLLVPRFEYGNAELSLDQRLAGPPQLMLRKEATVSRQMNSSLREQKSVDNFFNEQHQQQQQMNFYDESQLNGGATSGVPFHNPFDMDLDLNHDPLMTGLINQDVFQSDEVLQLLLCEKLNDIIPDDDLGLAPQRMNDAEASAFMRGGSSRNVDVDYSASSASCGKTSAIKHEGQLSSASYVDLNSAAVNNPMFYSSPSCGSGVTSQQGTARRKRRPEPLVIPTSVNNYEFAGQLCSPTLLNAGSSSRRRGGRTPPPYSQYPMVSPSCAVGSRTYWSGVGAGGGGYRVPPQSAPAYQLSVGSGHSSNDMFLVINLSSNKFFALSYLKLRYLVEFRSRSC